MNDSQEHWNPNSSLGVNQSNYNLTAKVEEFLPYHIIQRCIRNILTPILCILGIVGNIINLLVLTKIRRRKADGGKDNGAHLGLTCLAVSDMCFCMAIFPRAFIPSTTSLFSSFSIDLLYQSFGTGLVTTFILTSTWLTVVMTVIRYVAICHPFSARQINGQFFAKVSYSLVFILCAVFNIPSYFQYHITDINLGENEIFYLIDIGNFNHGTLHGQIFTWLKVTLGVFLPAVIMAFCNISLIRSLKQSYRMRRECSRNSGHPSPVGSYRITLILVIIVISFVILVFPSEIMDFFSDSIKMDATKTETFLTVRPFMNIFQILNFACNFVLYCAINVHFRGALWELVTCKKSHTGSNSRHTRMTSLHSGSSHVTFKNGCAELKPLVTAQNNSKQKVDDTLV